MRIKYTNKYKYNNTNKVILSNTKKVISSSTNTNTNKVLILINNKGNTK